MEKISQILSATIIVSLIWGSGYSLYAALTDLPYEMPYVLYAYAPAGISFVGIVFILVYTLLGE